MKNLVKTILAGMLLALFLPFSLKADKESSGSTLSETSSEAVVKARAEIETMVDRVLEIREMDRKVLTKEEKKELRKELKTIKKELKTYSKSESEAIVDAAAKGADRGGIYISSGALLIIIILLILL